LEQIATKEGLQHEGIVSYTDYIDRQQVEAEAWWLIEQCQQMPEVEVKWPERMNNGRTALMEAMTASGHLSSVEISGTLEEINQQILSRLLNGLDDSLPAHEWDRRFADLCSELVIQEIHKRIVRGELPKDTAVLELLDYPVALDDDQATELGYRRSNYKGMVLSAHLRDDGNGQYTRLIEQPSRSNATGRSTFGFLNAAGVQVESGPADIAALRTPCLYRVSDYRDGVVDIMRLLDKHAGPGVLYGDTGERAQQHIPYEQLRQESARREEEIECYIDGLASLESQLDGMVKSGKISYSDRTELFKGEVERILTAICTLNPGYAEDTFGKAAAPYFHEASLMEAAGDTRGAQDLLAETKYLREIVTFCGVSISVEEAQKQGLKVNSFSQLMEMGKNFWKWKEGMCVVKQCPTRPRKVEVGPCSVCHGCQDLFDKGKDPAYVYGSTQQEVKSRPKKESDWERIKREDSEKRVVARQARAISLAKKRQEMLAREHLQQAA